MDRDRKSYVVYSFHHFPGVLLHGDCDHSLVEESQPRPCKSGLMDPYYCSLLCLHVHRCRSRSGRSTFSLTTNYM